MQSKYIVPVVSLALVGAVTLGALHVSAEDTSTAKPLAQKLAEKFNLKQSDVEQVMTEHKTELRATMQTKIDARLTQLVKDDKLTEDQKQKVLAKQKELVANHEAMHEKVKDMTPEERKAEKEKLRTELETWAKDNSIDPQYLMPLGKAGHGMGNGLHHKLR